MDNQIQNMDNPSSALPEKKKFSFRLTRRLKILIFGLSTLIIISLLLSLVLKTQVSNKRTSSVTPTPALAEQDTNVDETQDSLRQELDSISDELDRINTLKTDLTMPLVQMELEIDSDMF